MSRVIVEEGLVTVERDESVELIDNGVVVPPSSGPVAPPSTIDPTLYDVDGWSLTDDGGCWAHYLVDQWIDHALNSGDEYQKTIANKWKGIRFAVIVPEKEVSEEDRKAVSLSYDTTTIAYGGYYFNNFYPDIVMDENRNVTRGEKHALYRTPTEGFLKLEVHEDCAENFLGYLKRQVEALRATGSPYEPPQPGPEQPPADIPEYEGRIYDLSDWFPRVGGLSTGVEQQFSLTFAAGRPQLFKFTGPEIPDGEDRVQFTIVDGGASAVVTGRFLDANMEEINGGGSLSIGASGNKKCRRYFNRRMTGKTFYLELTSRDTEHFFGLVNCL